MTDHDAAVGAQIRRHRKIKRLSQERLAEMAGLTRAQIYHIEVGNSACSLHQFMAIAHALGVDDMALLPPKPSASPRFPGMSWYEAPQ